MSEINGFLNIYKEAGFTSFDVVAKLRGILHTKKIGHMGTLDPDAEGVLPIAVGKATKAISLVEDTDKSYRAIGLLGSVTDTQDTSGEIISTSEVVCSETDISKAALAFVGGYDQIPPMYSAKKVDGRRLYDLAREGRVVERDPVFVAISSIELESVDLPHFSISVECGKGTYIRTLINDMGERLGCGACMEKLTRTGAGLFDIKDSVFLDKVETMVNSGSLREILYPIDYVFGKFPKVVCSSDSAQKLLNGGRVYRDDLKPGQKFFSNNESLFRVYLENRFLGIYEPHENYLKVKKILI